MKLSDFLKLCKDTEVCIINGKEEIHTTKYFYVYPYLDYEIQHFGTMGYEKIFVTLKSATENA